ncbi:MAG: sodium/solute symporter [Candidatus Hydrogenedentes bacterium]|nr:sodium/solute symporter [Candidatus Hydrogenedentota bacterium]
MPENFTMVDYAVLVLYFGAMASLGPIFAKGSKTTEGYLLGDRNFPGWLVGFSMFATSISSVAFVGYPGDSFKTAWYRMVPNYTMPLAVLFAMFFFLPFFRRTQITSAYEYLEARFGPITRMYAAAAFVVMQVVRVSLILYLVSVLLYTITGINPYVAILLGGVITSFYTVLGGITAVMWTDFIQSFVLWIGALICLFLIVYRLPGGVGEVIDVGMANHKFGLYDFLTPADKTMSPVPFMGSVHEKTIFLFLLVGLGNWLTEYSGNQNVVQRYAASKNIKQARIAMWVCACFSVPTWAMFMFLGTACYVFYQRFPDPAVTDMLTGVRKSEEILPFFVTNELPQGLTGLVIAGVLAAAMSSLSSSISAVSAVSLVDIYKRHIATDRDDKHYVFVAKAVGWAMSVIMIGGAAVLYAYDSKTLLDVATVLTALTSGGLLGLYSIGFFTKVGGDRSILLAILFTTAYTLYMTLVGLKIIPESMSLNHNYYTGLFGHIIMFVLGYAVGKLWPDPKKDLHNLTVWTQDKTPIE